MNGDAPEQDMIPALGNDLPDLPARSAAMPGFEPSDAQLPGMSALEMAASGVLSASSLPGSVMKIQVAIQVVIGSARVPLAQVAQLGPGAVITLDQKLGTPASILVNGKEVAKGELYVLDGEGDRLGITITEVVSSSGAGF